MPRALQDGLPVLSADELAWLATLDDVESRLIFTEQRDNRTQYRVEHGPFDEKLLGALPPQNWTLLVHDVEKHLPELRKYLQEASFISDWRVDDLMVSFAVEGGSVGPHRDNYDVFLCQGTGVREWRIATPTADLKSVESGGLSLLEPFVDDSPITASNGDVLYLPPGLAHWGIARKSCMTYSIGMRAPQMAEFGAAVARKYDNASTENYADESRFYCDPDLRVTEAEPGLISSQALERARSYFAAAANLGDEDFARAFGCVVTDVKAWLAPETLGTAELEAFLKSPSGISDVRVHGMARLAFCSEGNQELVFGNGFDRSASPFQMDFFRHLCANRKADKNLLQSILSSPEGSDLFKWLTEKGAFDLQSDGKDDAT